MARKSVKNVTYNDIEQVQNLIERSMQSYMSPKEVANSLLNEAKIEPKFTELVWQKLEEQNPEFFQSYYTRLALKQQIKEFNKLMHKQKELMDTEKAKVASLPTSNGFHYHDASSLPTSNGTHTPATTENPACYYVSLQTAEGLNPKNVQHGLESNLSYEFNNGGSSLGNVDMSAQGDFSSMHYSQNSNMGFQQGMNGGIAISEPEYPTSSTHMFGVDENVLEACPVVGNASAPPIFNNGTASPFRMVDMSAHGDFSSMHYSQNSNMSFQQGNNGAMAISEAEYPSSSRIFGVDENVMETSLIVGNAAATPIYNNGGSSFRMVEMSAHGDISSMYHSQNSNMGFQQGINGGMAISEPEYPSSSPLLYSVDENVMEAGPIVSNSSSMPIFNNGTGSPFRTVGISAHGDVSRMRYSQNSNMGFQQGINGGMTISEPASSSPHMFGVDGNVTEAFQNVGKASATSIFNSDPLSFDMVDVFAHGDIPTPSMPYSQNSNMGLQQGVNGQTTIVQPEYSSSPHMSAADRNAVKTDSNVRDASAMPITSVESNTDSDDEAVMDFLNTCSSFPDLASLFSGETDDDPFRLYNFPETPDMLTPKINS